MTASPRPHALSRALSRNLSRAAALRLIPPLRILALLALPAAAALAQPFDVVPTPNPSPERNLFRNVSGTSDRDVWAVGDARFGGVDRHIVYRWDGSVWTNTPAPFVNGNTHILFGVSALTQDDVWAAGLYSDFGLASAYILRWDGDSWELVHDRPGEPTLDIFAVSESDVWAVGATSDPRPTPALALHWNGSSWTRIDPPIVGDRNQQLDTVHASSSDNVWAAGFYRTDLGARRAYVVRWNGAAWENRSLPVDVLTTIDVLTFAPDDTWIGLDVGNAWHWDGSGWTEYPVALGAFAGVAPDEIYGFGAHDIHLWDGFEWTRIQTLEGLPSPAFRNGARALPDESVWAVGRTIEGLDQFRTLAVRKPPRDPAAVGPMAARVPGVALAAAGAMPATRLDFTLRLAEAQPVVLALFDASGRRLATLRDGVAAGGEHRFSVGGQGLQSGVHFVRATTPSGSATLRWVLVR